ncbi:phage tail protein [Erwinia sp. 9145]|uniref:phage tail protein n=1 Tax=Erwinia sp. 9145 TaxID=1500895 RepID=UPI000555A9A3|nr:phage tail protein [Erwinia sp. 9145]
MTAKYYAILTSQGAAKLANATALGTRLNLTQMAVGDANGSVSMPDAGQTTLINQKRIAPINQLSIDPNNTNQIIAEQIIPESEGGFWIREIGLFDDAGVLVAVANCPESYKPQLQEGSGRTQTIRMVLIVSSTAAVTLKIDPAVVLATRQYVDDRDAAHLAAANPHPQYLKVADIAQYTPVGVPLPYPSATPPAGWLSCNGATFDKAKYPGLAAIFPSGVLIELRGEFIRGWDDGRTLDNGRRILTTQIATSFRTAALDYPGIDSTSEGATIGTAFAEADQVTTSQPGEAKAPNNTALGGVLADNLITAKQLNTGLAGTGAIWVSMRPRNVALNYIIRAA